MLKIINYASAKGLDEHPPIGGFLGASLARCFAQPPVP